jgi:hypothetical protein
VAALGRCAALLFVCPAFGAPVLAQETPPARLVVQPGGFFEVAALAVNDHRKPGGNEEHYGEYVAGVGLDARFAPKRASALQALGFHASWAPADLVLDFADPQRANRHNQNWLRADGILSRPSLLAFLQADLGTRNRVQVRLGGFLASGLEPLDGAPSLYYLTMPAPLLHTQHWDKGGDVTYRFCPHGEAVVTLGLGLLDGDWAVGEASLARLHNSAANSYPSWAGHLEVHPLALAKGSAAASGGADLAIGVEATEGELGSFWSGNQPLEEKRRENNAVGYLRWSRRIASATLEARGFLTRMERNPLANGTGSHVPAVRTRGYGAEVAWRGVAIATARFDLYGNVWRMTNLSGVPDGEIWPAEFGLSTTEIHGFLVGARWVDPVVIATRVQSWVGFSFGQIVPDVPDAWGSSRGLRNLVRLVCTLRV